MHYAEENGMLNTQLARELTMNSLDVGIDFAEIGIDSLFESGVIEELPIVKTIAAMCKVGLAIKDRHFAKKLLIFLQEYHKGLVSKENLEKFKKELQNDEKYRNKVIEFIMIMLDRYIENEKAILMSRIFAAYINGKCTYEQFVEMNGCLDLIFISDCKILGEIYLLTKQLGQNVENRYINFDDDRSKVIISSIGRLRANGLISARNVAVFGGGPDNREDVESRLTNFGKLFCDLALGLAQR